MTISVNSVASPLAKRRRIPGAPALAPVPNAAALVRALNSRTLPQAPAAPATPTAATTPQQADVEVKTSPEYDDLSIASAVGSVAGTPWGTGVSGDLLAPHVKRGVGHVINPDTIPWVGSPVGSLLPGKVAGAITSELSSLVGALVEHGVRKVTGEEKEGEEEKEAGFHWQPTAPNKLVAKVVKGVAKSYVQNLITPALFPPPPPPPPPAPKPGDPPLPPAPPVKPLLKVMGKEVSAVLKDGAMSAFGNVIMGGVYDQVVGPLVQRAVNVVTGKAGEEIKPPKPITPGSVVSAFVDGSLGSLLIRSFELPAPATPGGSIPFSASLGMSVMNNVIGAAWQTVYDRSMAPAIENGVNNLVGIRSKEEQAKDTLPALERFTRSASRGVAVGATTYVLGSALQNTMVHLGASIGGVGGLLVGMAGAALIGSVGGTVVDATIGPAIGRFGGQIYTWITGKPAYEQRMKDAAKGPSSAPGDPVNAPNGNPGTVPSEPAAPAPGAPGAVTAPMAPPVEGQPKKRKKTGNAAVDRTAPAMNVPSAKLVQVAAAS